MVLILSNDGDLSCDLVQDWLDFYHYPYLRINSWEFLRKPISVSLVNGEFSFTMAGKKIDLDSIHSIWYRKYGLFRCTETYRRLISTHKMDEELINHLSKEYARSIQTLLIALKDEKWLTNPMYMNVSKLEVLKVASDCGLNTSATYLVNDRNQLAHLVEKKNLISKSVFDPIIAEWGKRNRGMMYTVEVNKEELSALPSSFLPSMVQEKLEKKYELRIFYLNGKMYPMAIFSQKDNQTQLDFRNYNWEKPNRMEPCKLNVDLKKKIRKLMYRLYLNCGSIDLIVAKDGKTYFLEVNPTGQFGMVDFPCNYGLHKIVAEELIKMDNYGFKNKII